MSSKKKLIIASALIFAIFTGICLSMMFKKIEKVFEKPDYNDPVLGNSCGINHHLEFMNI